jgi:hypothetical protein
LSAYNNILFCVYEVGAIRDIHQSGRSKAYESVLSSIERMNPALWKAFIHVEADDFAILSGLRLFHQI